MMNLQAWIHFTSLARVGIRAVSGKRLHRSVLRTTERGGIL
jgi:hypothetical protein